MFDRLTTELLDLTTAETGDGGPRLASFLQACCCSSCCRCLALC